MKIHHDSCALRLLRYCRCLSAGALVSFGLMTETTLRPALAALAQAPDETTVRKLWKALTPEERTLAITASLADDQDGWVKASTRAVVAKALKFRPQTVAQLPRQKLIADAARLPIDDVQLLGGYLVDLHLGHRRPMMRDFLDALGIKNDEGRIDSEATEVPVQDEAAVARAADAIAGAHPRDEVVFYFLTLLLQDETTWGGVKAWLVSHSEL